MPDAAGKHGATFKDGLFVRYIWQSLIISVIGFLLVNASFLLDFLWHNSVTLAIMQMTGSDPNMLYTWYPPALKVAFLLLVMFASYFVLTSRFNTIIKAAFLVVPVATLLLTTGILFAGSSTYATLSCVVILAGILYWLSKHGMPWQYLFSVTLAGIGSLAFIITGM